MQSSLRKLLFPMLCALLVPLTLLAQSQPPTHPLEALKTQEYWTVYDVLRDSGKMQPETATISVLFHEPPKDKVLGWKQGDPMFREADVILLQKGVTIEALVDISGHKLESWKERKDVQVLLEAVFEQRAQPPRPGACEQAMPAGRDRKSVV